MLSEETESKIIKILKTIADGENTIEINRKLLSDNSDFDSFQIFTNMAPKGKEFITPADIVEYFNNKKIFISYTEAKLLVLFYDQNYDGKLSYSEFVPLVESKNSEKKTTSKSPVNEIPLGIEHYVITLFQKEVDLIKSLIGQLYDLRIKDDFNCHSIYHALKNVNKITEDSIGDFFEKKLVTFMNEDLIAIIKRLDINKDGIVDLCELHAFFGFPNCTFCCSCTECPVCGTCCCDECLPDIPCYLHKIVHHQNHSPLKSKTQCYFNGNKGDEQKEEEEVYYSPLRKLNKELNKDLTLLNYELNNCNNNNIEVNCINCGNCEEQEMNNIYMKNEPVNECKECISNYKFSTPRDNYNSNSEMGSTFQSFSPSCQNYSPNTIFREKNPSSSNFNFSSSFSLKDGEYEEEQFIIYLNELMSVENDIEKGKIDLLTCNDFNCEDVFGFFDIDHKGYLTFDDLKYGLGKLDLYPEDNEIKLLFNRFDQQKCGNISYENFMRELEPCDRSYRNRIDNLPYIGKNDDSENNLSYDTMLYLKNLLKIMISGEYKLNLMREDCSGINFSTKNIFGLVDFNGCGFFLEKDLKCYLIQNGIFRDDKRCALIFYKFDKKKDGKVDICEFENEFQHIV